jgi:hypothetical protein
MPCDGLRDTVAAALAFWMTKTKIGCRSLMNSRLFTGDQHMFVGEQPPNYYKDY